MCVLVCSHVWLFGTPWTPPALAKVDLTSHTGTPSLLYISTPRWFPSESLQQLFSFIHFISIFTWEGCSSFVHPTHARPILSSFYSEHHLISRSFGICCFQPVGGTSRNLEQGRRKRSWYFFPIPSLLWCHVSGQWLGPSTMMAPMKQLLLHHSNSFFKKKFYLFIYLAASGLSWGMQDLSMQHTGSSLWLACSRMPGTEPASPSIGKQMLNHWTTR